MVLGCIPPLVLVRGITLLVSGAMDTATMGRAIDRPSWR